LLAPIVIQPLGDGVFITVTLLALAALVYAIIRSKQGSMSSEFEAAAAQPAAAAGTPGDKVE
ncbi:MAG: hypothetical protein MH204_00795, partial [Fimbriimonadaceae bacterium]|nr:hypothetical protein [Fimbriimonadaceae bacterium]